MKLFQFWNSIPPTDIAELMETARTGQPDFDYVRFDDVTGRIFIGDRYGARELAVWDALALPAMRSDFIRLLLIDTFGGVYVDGSYEFFGNLSDFVATAPTAQLPKWVYMINNNYMMFREPGHPFIRAAIALLIENVEQRRFGSALMVSGPGVMNSIRCVISPEERANIMGLGQCNADWMRWGWEESIRAADRLIEPTEELTAAYRAMTLVPLDELHKSANSKINLSHRHADTHWLKWKGDIYR